MLRIVYDLEPVKYNLKPLFIGTVAIMERSSLHGAERCIERQKCFVTRESQVEAVLDAEADAVCKVNSYKHKGFSENDIILIGSHAAQELLRKKEQSDLINERNWKGTI